MENDLRLVSLTCQIAKVMEGFTLTWILPSILDRIDSKQFAVAAKSTEQALVYILHLPLKPWIRETVLCGSLLLISVRDLTWSTTRFSCVNYLISTYTAAWSSSETQGQIVGARESLNGWKNMARRKVKNGEKSPWRQCLTRPVPNGHRRSGFWLVRENFCVFLPNQKSPRMLLG